MQGGHLTTLRAVLEAERVERDLGRPVFVVPCRYAHHLTTHAEATRLGLVQREAGTFCEHHQGRWMLTKHGERLRDSIDPLFLLEQYRKDHAS